MTTPIGTGGPRLLGAFCLILALVMGPQGPAAAAVHWFETLPVPAAPPSSMQALAAHLCTQLLEGVTRDAASAWSLEVRFDGNGVALGRTPATDVAPTHSELSRALDAQIEARLRVLGANGARQPASVPGIPHIDVIASLDGTTLNVTAVFSVAPQTIWVALRQPMPVILARGHAHAPLDIELRALLGVAQPRNLDAMALTALTGRSPKAFRGAGPCLDIWAGDRDGDGVQDWLVLFADRMVAMRGPIQSKAQGPQRLPKVVRVLELSAAKTQRARPRTPFGRIISVVDDRGQRRWVVASSDRAKALVVRAEGDQWTVARAPTDGWPLYATAAGRWIECPWPRATDRLTGPLREVALNGGDGPELIAPQAFYALSRVGFRAPSSDPWRPFGVMVGTDGRLWVGDGRGGIAQFFETGAAWAMGDLDGDGTAELLLTSATVSGPEELRVISLGPGGASRIRWTHRVDSPVTALTPLPGAGVLVAGWTGERAAFWVARPVQ